MKQVRVKWVDSVRKWRLCAHPPLQLRVLADVRGNEARGLTQDQILGKLLVLHQLGPGHAHDFDADRTLTKILDIRRSVWAGTGEADPCRIRMRLVVVISVAGSGCRSCAR